MSTPYSADDEPSPISSSAFLQIGLFPHRAWMESNGEDRHLTKCKKGNPPADESTTQNIPRHTTARSHRHLIKRLGLTGRCDAIETEDGSTASSVQINTRTPQRLPSHTSPQSAACLRKSASKKPAKPSAMRGALHQPQQNRARRYIRRDIRTAEEYVHHPRTHRQPDSAATPRRLNPLQLVLPSPCVCRQIAEENITRVVASNPRQPSGAPHHARIERPSNKGASSCSTSAEQPAAYPSNVCTASLFVGIDVSSASTNSCGCNCTIIWCSRHRPSLRLVPTRDRTRRPGRDATTPRSSPAQGHLPIASRHDCQQSCKPA